MNDESSTQRQNQSGVPADHKAAGDTPRKQWMDYKTRKVHPPFFVDLLEGAIGIFVFEKGTKQIYWTTIILLYKALVEHEIDNLPLVVMEDDGQITKGGLLLALKSCAEPHLLKPPPPQAWWDVKNFVDEGAAERSANMNQMEQERKGNMILYVLGPLDAEGAKESNNLLL
jgi:hypothetical protein